jgi:hypothetical protein
LPSYGEIHPECAEARQGGGKVPLSTLLERRLVGSGVGMGPELRVPRGRSGHGARGGGCRAREMAVVTGSARGMQGGPKPGDDDNISRFLVVGFELFFVENSSLRTLCIQR